MARLEVGIQYCFVVHFCIRLPTYAFIGISHLATSREIKLTLHPCFIHFIVSTHTQKLFFLNINASLMARNLQNRFFQQQWLYIHQMQPVFIQYSLLSYCRGTNWKERCGWRDSVTVSIKCEDRDKLCHVMNAGFSCLHYCTHEQHFLTSQLASPDLHEEHNEIFVICIISGRAVINAYCHHV